MNNNFRAAIGKSHHAGGRNKSSDKWQREVETMSWNFHVTIKLLGNSVAENAENSCLVLRVFFTQAEPKHLEDFHWFCRNTRAFWLRVRMTNSSSVFDLKQSTSQRYCLSIWDHRWWRWRGTTSSFSKSDSPSVPFLVYRRLFMRWECLAH